MCFDIVLYGYKDKRGEKMNKPSILFIYAHPDDETVYSAGTIAKYAKQGANISLITATCGEKGRTSGECKQAELADVRRKELTEVTRKLGVNRTFMLNYPDGSLSEVPVPEITAKIAEIIREVRPDVLITFDEDGANGHRDHKAIHTYSTLAIARAKNKDEVQIKGEPYTVEVIYYTDISTEICSYLGLSYKHHDKVTIIDIQEFAKVKFDALKTHRTQTLSLSPFVGANDRLLPYIFSEERFFIVDEHKGKYLLR